MKTPEHLMKVHGYRPFKEFLDIGDPEKMEGTYFKFFDFKENVPCGVAYFRDKSINFVVDLRNQDYVGYKQIVFP